MRLQLDTAGAGKDLRRLGEVAGLPTVLPPCKDGWVLICALGPSGCPLKTEQRAQNSAEPMTALR